MLEHMPADVACRKLVIDRSHAQEEGVATARPVGIDTPQRDLQRAIFHVLVSNACFLFGLCNLLLRLVASASIVHLPEPSCWKHVPSAAVL